jgi:hypothetical protein
VSLAAAPCAECASQQRLWAAGGALAGALVAGLAVWYWLGRGG